MDFWRRLARRSKQEKIRETKMVRPCPKNGIRGAAQTGNNVDSSRKKMEKTKEKLERGNR